MRIPGLNLTPFPPAPDISKSEATLKVAEFLKNGNGKTLILTGAGVSVDSGIRAYRGPAGSYVVNKKHRPIFYHELMSNEKFRRRYWARSFLGYPPVRDANPNPIHYSLEALRRMKVISRIITQNVDGLHRKAFDTSLATFPHHLDQNDLPLMELHGTLKHVECVSCLKSIEREPFQDLLKEMNPEWAQHALETANGKEERLNPDGDVDLGPNIRYEDFRIPSCPNCDGILKPKVVFFGEPLSEQIKSLANDWCDQASQILVIGSSLATFSAYRLVSRIKDNKGQAGLINIGPSRGDHLMDFRIGREEGAGEILPEIVRKLAKQDCQSGFEELLALGRVKTVHDRYTTQ